MQLDRKVLAFGQLPSSKGDLYVPASGRKGYAHNLTLHNTNTTAEDVVLNYHDGTSEHEILSETLPAGDSLYLTFPGEGEVVGIGGKLTGNTTTASKVTFKFSGTEEIPDPIVGGTGVESNLWVAPTPPHAYDEEFDGVSMSAWNVRNITDGTTGSFSLGAVDPYDTTFSAGDAVRANLGDRNSWVLLQAPARNKGYMIWKSITLPTNLLVITRFKIFRNRTSVNDDAVFGLTLGTLSGGVPVVASRVVMIGGAPSGGQNRPFTQLWNTGGSEVNTHIDAIVDDGTPYPHAYVALHKVGADYHYYVGNEHGSWSWFDSVTSIGFTPDYVGLELRNTSTSAPGVAVVGVDFVRFLETDKFLL